MWGQQKTPDVITTPSALLDKIVTAWDAVTAEILNLYRHFKTKFEF
jgi:hypothetical protein